MPFDTNWEKQGVYHQFSGQLTNRDRKHAMHEVMGDERFDTMKYWIIDTLAIKECMLEKSDVVDAAAFNIGAAYHNNNILMAFAATNTDHQDNILHFMKILKSGCNWKVRLFDDIESARQWITEILKYNP